MSAAELRQAAALMRERAEAAPDDMATPSDMTGWACDGSWIVDYDERAANHFAHWHPAVALAVADWLDTEANHVESGYGQRGGQALAVARAYLGVDR